MNRDHRYQIILLSVCLVLFSFYLGGRDLWAPDEPRYAGIARAILETGDWLVLRDNARPYTDKPPLFFWLVAGLARLGPGVNEFTSRLPSSLFGLLTVLLTYRLGRNLFSPRVGLIGGLVLATAPRFFLEARWVHIDMLLSFLVLLSMDAAYRAWNEGETWRWAVVYAALSLGCLAKGPVAFGLTAAGLITFLASNRELRRLHETRWMWGLPLTLLPSAAWLWMSAGGTGVEPWEVIRMQVWERFQAGVHHGRPFYYYLYHLPLAFLPWAFFLAGTVKVTFPAPGHPRRRPLLFLYGWLLGGVVLLSLSAEKRPSYLLPVFPALALLVALLWEEFLVRWESKSLRRWIGIPFYAYAGLCLLGLLAAAPRAIDYPGLSYRLSVLAAVYLAAGGVSLTALRAEKRGWSLLSWVGGLLVGYLWIAGSILPWLNDYKSARPFSQRVVQRVGSAPLGIYHDYQPAFSYYTHRSLEVFQRPEELASFLGPPLKGYCLVEQGDFDQIFNEVPLHELDREEVGHRTMLLVERVRPLEDSEP